MYVLVSRMGIQAQKKYSAVSARTSAHSYESLALFLFSFSCLRTQFSATISFSLFFYSSAAFQWNPLYLEMSTRKTSQASMPRNGYLYTTNRVYLYRCPSPSISVAVDFSVAFQTKRIARAEAVSIASGIVCHVSESLLFVVFGICFIHIRARNPIRNGPIAPFADYPLLLSDYYYYAFKCICYEFDKVPVCVGVNIEKGRKSRRRRCLNC